MMVFTEWRKVDGPCSHKPLTLNQSGHLPPHTRTLSLACCLISRKPDGRFLRFAVAIPPRASANNAREICLNLHLGKERLQITSGLSLGGGPSSDYVIGILISLDMQLMRGTKG